ncbi:unnamed protein product [Amoebophrya sp. A25]|nr:unnamed protein product [Amoebophrya sp. A25]|eukprot:GSA25T00020715001.1
MFQESAEKVAPLLQNGISSGAEQGMDAINSLIQQGPRGVSKLAFLISLITTAVGLLEIIMTILNPLSIFFAPFHLVLSCYIVLFGAAGMVLECDVEWLAGMKYWPLIQFYIPDVMTKLQEYQKIVFHRANFLTEVHGRAGFYGFLGILCATQCFLCPFFLVGLINMGLAGLLVYLMREETVDLSYQHVREKFFEQMHNVAAITNKAAQGMGAPQQATAPTAQETRL